MKGKTVNQPTRAVVEHAECLLVALGHHRYERFVREMCAMVSSVGQNVNLGTADGGTMRLLVCIDRTRGVAQHIPNLLGYPLCKTPIRLSLWQLEERPVDTTLICHICKQKQAKLARP